ncbi:hypothetical protein DFS33DRAFT_1502661, partial [Desarmillaria ectypa]
MNYQGSNSSTKRSRSDISLADDSPPGKRSSPPLLLDERLTPEEVQSIVDIHLAYSREELPTVIRDDPFDKTKLLYLVIFTERLLRGAGNFDKAEIDIDKISPNSLQRLLQTEEEFFDVVLNAARKVCDQENTHQSVRDLFRIGAIRLPQMMSVLSSINRARLATAAVQAWNSQYIGDYPAAIIAEIENHLAFSKLDGHGYIGAMIQSSGTGKSRTMHEIAAQIFTIPINIREYSSGSPYPDPDTELRNYLIYPHGNLQIRYLCFLYTLLEKVREVLKTLGGDKTEEDTALRWKSYLAEGNNREILYDNITREARRLEAEDVLSRSDPYSEKVKLTRRIKKAYRDLISMLTANPSKNLKLLIYIDGAHTLIPRDVSAQNNYASLCSVMAELDDPYHFIMFMSTSGALSLPVSNSVSVREFNIIATLPAPFIVLPFDVCANIQCNDPELTFERIRSIRHLARLGRPMTKLTHKDCTPMPKFGIHMREPGTVMSGSGLRGELDVFKMALVDIRVMIEYEPRREESRRLQEEMVRAHMRMMFSAPAHGEYTTSGYPSEPILAEAAAISIYEERVDMVQVVHRLFEDDLLDNDERCQLVARIILTKAWDAAIHRLLLDKKHPTMPDSHPALLPEEHLYKLFQSMADNRVGGVTFAEAFEYAYVHFAHFGRAGSSDAINSGFGMAAFIRGMAYQCSFGHSLVDIFIPLLIFYGRNDTISAEALGFWLDEDTDIDVPYIVITMQLAGSHSLMVSSSSQGSPTTPLAPSSAIERLLDTETKLPWQFDRKGHPRYTINISGCSPSVYKVINTDEQYKYLDILSFKGILNKHPYKKRASVVLLRKMKPIWSADPICFDW